MHARSAGRVPFILVSAISAVMLAYAAPARAADDKDGEAVFNNACRTCHSTKPDDNRLGPTLHGIVGKAAGSTAGFNYSGSMKNAGLTWDEATLDKFIANPDAVVQGNNMKPFTGISDEAQRKAIIGFLASRR